MILYVLVFILSFGLGLLSSLMSYISTEIVVLLVLLIGFLVKVLAEYIPFSGGQMKWGLGLMLPYVLNLMKKKTPNATHNIKIEKDRIILEFDHKGKQRRHILPYNRKELAKHNKHTVHLIDDDGKEIEISQIPGVKFTHSAKEIGGKSIKVTNKITQEVTIYENEPPQFL